MNDERSCLFKLKSFFETNLLRFLSESFLMWKTHNFANPIYILTIFSTLISISFSALAGEDAPQTFSLSGTLYQSGTNIPLQDPNTKLLIQILNPDKTCLLYEELQTINVKSNGFFNVS